MTVERSLSGHYFLRAAILVGFAVYIIYLVKTDNILYYIAPRMVIYVKLSAIGFYAVVIYQIYLAFGSLWKRKSACNCEHPPSSSRFRNTLFYSLFSIPLPGFLLPDSAMGSSLAAKRGVNLSAGLNLELNLLFKADKYDAGFAQIGKNLYQKDVIQVENDGFIESLSSLDMFMNNFIGKKIEISGFVYRENEMKVTNLWPRVSQSNAALPMLLLLA